MTLSNEELDDTLEVYGIEAKASMSDAFFDKAKRKAKAKLKTLIADKVAEAQIDEILQLDKGLMLNPECQGCYNNNGLISQRLSELQLQHPTKPESEE